MYEVVLIDADNTLFDFDRAGKYALKKALEKFKYKGDINRIYKRYKRINSKLWLELEKDTITKEELMIKRFRELFKEFKVKYPYESFNEYYLENLGKASFLITGAEEICAYLSKKYILVVITNGTKEVQLSRLNNSPIKKYFTEIVISEEIGVNKPHPHIFEYTLKLLGHKNKESVIIIGDSLTSDIKGGINFEIDTCWFNKNDEENLTDIKPDYQIKRLKELYDIL